jgi:hypothetical protein
MEICDYDKDFLTCDIYEFKEIANVKSVGYEFNKWLVEFDDTIINDQITYIFIIDTLLHDAFCHWVFESAIYLPFFILLKKKYPKLKLFLKEFKNYKKLFCDYFEINEDDVIYKLEYSNICLFPKPISSLNINYICEKLKLQIDKLILELNFKCFNYDKSINTLFLPRQNKENFKNNERIYDTHDILENISVSYQNLILNTDEINDLNDQIQKVNSSKNIILMGGSAYFVNGIFCKNSKIIVLDDFCINQINSYIKMKYIHDKICENNSVIFINNNKNNTFYYNDIRELI